MLKDISLGQYMYRDSIIHKLDPRIKIMMAIFIMLAIFLVGNFYGYILFLLLFLIAIFMSKIPLMKVIKGLRAILPFIILSSILNLVFIQGKVIFHFWIINVTQEGLIQGAFIVTRIILIVMFSTILTLSTSPFELTAGIEGLLKPLKKIKVPAHEIAMMMSIALRFIPTLIEEADKIMKAQKARGANFEEGSIFKRAKALIPVLVPLFINSFSRADELSQAMESRGYRGDVGRTKFRPLKYSRKDLGATLVFGIFVLLVFAMFFLQRLK